jgi:hypothetical protein
VKKITHDVFELKSPHDPKLSIQPLQKEEELQKEELGFSLITSMMITA